MCPRRTVPRSAQGRSGLYGPLPAGLPPPRPSAARATPQADAQREFFLLLLRPAEEPFRQRPVQGLLRMDPGTWLWPAPTFASMIGWRPHMEGPSGPRDIGTYTRMSDTSKGRCQPNSEAYPVSPKGACLSSRKAETPVRPKATASGTWVARSTGAESMVPAPQPARGSRAVALHHCGYPDQTEQTVPNCLSKLQH